MKKVLIVAPFCSLPGEAYFNRFLYLAQLLSSSFDVTLLTSSFRHFDKSQRAESFAGLPYRVVLIPEPGYRDNISISRVYSHWKFVRNFKKWMRREFLSKRYDVVYSAYPLLQTNILLGAEKKKYGYKLIVDVQDIWPEALAGALPFIGRIPQKLLPFSRRANLAYAAADELIAVSDTYLKRAGEANGWAPGKVIYIGSDAERINSISPRILEAKSLNFVYLGTLGHSYDLRTVLLAFAQFHELHLDFRLHILGDGPLKGELMKLASPLVKFYGFVNYDEMIAIAKGADCLINPINKSAKQSVTNKLSDYILLQKPIISSQKNPEAISILEKAGAIYYEAGDVQSFIEAVDVASSNLYRAMPQELINLFDRRLSYEHIRGLIESAAS